METLRNFDKTTKYLIAAAIANLSTLLSTIARLCMDIPIAFYFFISLAIFLLLGAVVLIVLVKFNKI